MFVDITDDAESDLEEIGDFIARKGSPKRAETFVEELEQACMTLADTPLLFPLIPRYEERGIRHRVHGNYQIFYRVVEAADRIDVLRILNSRRDYLSILFP
jgi:plasmid stabilization system protein ParE